MTTLYKPVKIESAEQAEALPVGTVAFDRPRGGGIPEASVKNENRSWTGTLDGGKPYEALQMVGDYALVPIEAEEEWSIAHADDPPAWSPVPRGAALDAAERGAPVFVRHRTRWVKFNKEDA